MLDHIGITVSDVKRSKAFYALALKPLGIAVQLLPTPEMMQAGHEGYGFGEEGKPYFWFGSGSSPIHIAFAAGTRSDVDAFYQAAIARAAATMARRESGNIITPAITAPSCWIPTGTISRPSVIDLSKNLPPASEKGGF